jgi:hypothetical protein
VIVSESAENGALERLRGRGKRSAGEVERARKTERWRGLRGRGKRSAGRVCAKTEHKLER